VGTADPTGRLFSVRYEAEPLNELNQHGWSKCPIATSPSRRLYEPEASCMKIGIAILNYYRGCIFAVNQHGWSKFCLATLVHENTDCTFSDSRGCIFAVKIGWHFTCRLVWQSIKPHPTMVTMIVKETIP